MEKNDIKIVGTYGIRNGSCGAKIFFSCREMLDDSCNIICRYSAELVSDDFSSTNGSISVEFIDNKGNLILLHGNSDDDYINARFYRFKDNSITTPPFESRITAKNVKYSIEFEDIRNSPDFSCCTDGKTKLFYHVEDLTHDYAANPYVVSCYEYLFSDTSNNKKSIDITRLEHYSDHSKFEEDELEDDDELYDDSDVIENLEEACLDDSNGWDSYQDVAKYRWDKKCHLIEYKYNSGSDSIDGESILIIQNLDTNECFAERSTAIYWEELYGDELEEAYQKIVRRINIICNPFNSFNIYDLFNIVPSEFFEQIFPFDDVDIFRRFLSSLECEKKDKLM